jgi:hypothetical protein
MAKISLLSRAIVSFPVEENKDSVLGDYSSSGYNLCLHF